ncbi:MAG: nucleotide sugar dehydrogenase, partial [Proteobacteria bacterium]|nr:nucleotide sugar dehydrogenase [Pseudomonadota bacterium]
GLTKMLGAGVEGGYIQAADDVDRGISESDISFICVGTPSDENGDCDLGYLRTVSTEIGEALRTKGDYHLVVFRSTVPPTTTREILLPIIEGVSGKKAGVDFGLCFHPEFLREGTALADFFAPPKTVIGSLDAHGGRVLARLYEGIDDNIIFTDIEAAEMVKYVDNTWHALKVSFANEIGKICKACGVDSHAVMDIFVRDTKLNLSPYYLKPGFAFGGSCLPKDVRGITRLASKHHIQTPVLDSILASNEAQIGHAISLIEKTGSQRIGFLGVTFKSYTDDLRESPTLPVIAAFLGKGYDVRIYDPNLNLDAAVRHHSAHSKHAGARMNDLMDRLADLVCESVEAVCEYSDTIVISHNSRDFMEAALHRRDDQQVVDLVRLFSGHTAAGRMDECGINDYLQKPVRREQLKKKIDRWVDAGGPGPGIVLLVDDDPMVHEVARGMFHHLEVELASASSGPEALRMMKGNRYDAVLLDLTMPGMDGFDTALEIRSLPGDAGDVPIIAFTAIAAPEEAHTYEGICW